MKPPSEHRFGGDWTGEKLERVSKYLSAYTTIMNRYNFLHAYIDAFAGTGYRTLRNAEDPSELLLPELAEPETQSYLEGSARIALEIDPPFHRYIFIDNDPAHISQLELLKGEFPHLSDRIEIKNGDANTEILGFCRGKDWLKHDRRAVLFLDPYGMQVAWETITAIAKTQAIDLWYLFPLGIGLNRLLRRDGNIDETIRLKIDEILGDKNWFDVFYKLTTQTSFLDDGPEFEKTANFKTIEQYFVKRLGDIFPNVAHNPLPLRNSRGNPLYLLCFAAANPKGAPTAVKIAEHILGN